MTRIPVFTSIETFSQISTFESFVFTFYLNERVKTQKITLVQMKVIMYLCIDLKLEKWQK